MNLLKDTPLQLGPEKLQIYLCTLWAKLGSNHFVPKKTLIYVFRHLLALFLLSWLISAEKQLRKLITFDQQLDGKQKKSMKLFKKK